MIRLAKCDETVRVGLVALLWLAIATPAVAQVFRDALPPEPSLVSGREVLGRALEHLHGYDEIQRLEFRVHAPGQETLSYEAEIVKKHKRGSLYTLMHVVGDSDIRDRRTLRIESPNGRIESFVWLPELRRVRRISLAQRSDTLIGSDVSTEDFVIHRLEWFEILGRSSSQVRGEPVHIITVAQPLVEAGYDRADFFVAQSDFALLEVRFYKHGAEEAFKVMRAAREDMLRMQEFVVPRLLTFYNRERRTHTEVHYLTRILNPPLSDRLFTKTALESRRPLISRSMEQRGWAE